MADELDSLTGSPWLFHSLRPYSRIAPSGNSPVFPLLLIGSLSYWMHATLAFLAPILNGQPPTVPRHAGFLKTIRSTATQLPIDYHHGRTWC